MITFNRNQVTAKTRIDYPIFEVLEECRRAAGLNTPRSAGYPHRSNPGVLFVEDDGVALSCDGQKNQVEEEVSNEHDHHQRWNADLLQGLG